MKRYFLFVFALVSAIALNAETNIQREFLGLTVGKTTVSEVQTIMKSRGFELLNNENVSNVSSQFQFKGYYKHQGVEFHTIVTSFLNDTLFVFCAHDSCGESASEKASVLQKNLEVLYGNLIPADSTFLFSFFKDSADHYGVKTWSRMDDHTMIISMQSEEKVTCMYIDQDIFYSIMYAGLRQMGMPDYSEENRVYGVAGVKFGDDIASVKKVICPKAEHFLDEDAHNLTYYKVKIGGSTYDYANFLFAKGKLSSVRLQKVFYSWRKEEALMAFEGVKSQYERRYTNFKVIKDEYEEKLAICGAYIDGYDYPPIVISFEKSLSKGGDIMYYVIVSYYGMRTDNIYDDEI